MDFLNENRIGILKIRAREHLYYMQISGTGIPCHATIPRQDFDLHLLSGQSCRVTTDSCQMSKFIIYP